MTVAVANKGLGDAAVVAVGVLHGSVSRLVRRVPAFEVFCKLESR